MADYKATTSEFQTVANAIRTRGGTSASLAWPDGFASAISAIPSDVDSIVDGTAENVVLSSAEQIWQYAFIGKSALKTISASVVTLVSIAAFSNCINLSAANIPECTRINPFAFADCKKLNAVSFPECSLIEGDAFRNCNLLSEVNIPKCETIQANAFQSCSAIRIASLPTCKSIAQYAFRGCISLESLYLLSPTVAFLANANAFQNTPISVSTYLGHFGSIFVPESLVDEYKSARNWSAYSDRITAYVEG